MSSVSNLRLLYQQDRLPILQNRTYETASEAKACPLGDIRLVENQKSGLVYNSAFVPSLMVYDTSYQNEQALSPIFRQHLECVATVLGRVMSNGPIVEIGCGKGYFLEMLSAKGFDVNGFDPAYEGNNPKIIKRYYEGGITASGLVLRHVLEHISEPYAFLRQLKEANGGHQKIYIEVPCFDWICEHRAWFDIFFEHVNYFRIYDFVRMFDSVIESGRVFNGQYLYVVADLDTLKEPVFDGGNRVDFPDDFITGVDRMRRIDSRPIVIWGAASKGVIFSLLRSRAGEDIASIIDINPAKQGKYLPSTGFLVQSPGEVLPRLQEDAVIYVMNSNYFDEIREMSNYAFECVKVDHG